MISQFTVLNFMSYNKEAVLDLRAISEYKAHKNVLIDLGNDSLNLLRVVAIYGANASGKSNLCQAFRAFRKIVLESGNEYSEGNKNVIRENYQPYSLLKSNNKKDDEACVSFKLDAFIDDEDYVYGFEFNDEEIVREWLYHKSKNSNRKKVVYEKFSNGKIKVMNSIPAKIKNSFNLVKKDTLLLTFAAKLKDCPRELLSIYNFIKDTKVLGTDFYEAKNVLETRLPSEIKNNKDSLIKFLDAMDIGIKDITMEIIENNEIAFLKHRGKNGDFTLPLYRESEGTIKAISLYLFVRDAIDKGNTLFIDELNVKLHPLMLKFIIDLFYDEKSSAQLIYTSHDLTLLDSRFFRRDQIYFVEKNELGESELIALSDYKYIKDEDIRENYLAGVYGGIPYLKDYKIEVEDESQR